MGLFSKSKNTTQKTTKSKTTPETISEPKPVVKRDQITSTASAVMSSTQFIGSNSVIANQHKLLEYINITSPQILYDQLLLIDVRPEFKPKSPAYCAIIDSQLNEEGHLSDHAIQQIKQIAADNAQDSENAWWLLVFTAHPSSPDHKLATLVCLPDYHQAQAVAHNARGMRFPDAVIQFIEQQVDDISHTVNANSIMSKPRVTTFFEGGIGGFSGDASSCLTRNLSDALPIMSAAWDKQLSLEQTAAPMMGTGMNQVSDTNQFDNKDNHKKTNIGSDE